MECDYPGLRELLQSEVRRLKGMGRPYSQRSAATSLGVKPTTFHDWLHGTSFPDSEDKIKRLVSYFYEGVPSEDSSRLETQLTLLRDAKARTYRPEDLPNITLRFACFELPPFADYDSRREHRKAEGFLDRLLARFAELGNLKFDGTQGRVNPDLDVVQALRDGRMDVGIGIYELINRSDISTVSSNLRIGFNAVMVEDDPVLDAPARRTGPQRIEPGAMENIRRAINSRGPVDFTPVVGKMKSEVGMNFLQHVMGYLGRTEYSGFDPGAYAKLLVELSDGGERPVMLGDEWHCLLVLEQLRNLGRTGLLVFPLSTEYSAQRFKRDLPAYSVGLISLSLRHSDLVAHAQRLLSLFLRNETEFVSRCLKELYEELSKQIVAKLSFMSARGRQTLRWNQREECRDPRFWEKAISDRLARYVCRLNPAETNFGLDYPYLSLPWAPIIRRVQGELGPVEDEIQDPAHGRFVLGVRELNAFVTIPEEGREWKSVNDLGPVGQILRPIAELVSHENLPVIRKLRSSGASNEDDQEHAPDVRIGWFATPVRALNWVPFRLPIRVAMNSLARPLDLDPHDIPFLREALIPKIGAKSLAESGLKPVALRGGSSAEYLENTLGTDPSQFLWVEELEPEGFVKMLKSPGPSSRDHPFVVVDGLSCLSVLEKLGDEGRLVFPLVPGPDSDTPAFHVCIAVRRSSEEWVQFFQAHWPITIDSNIPWMSRVLVRAHEEICSFVRKHMGAIDQFPQAAESIRSLHIGPSEEIPNRLADWCLGFERGDIGQSQVSDWKGEDLVIWKSVRERALRLTSEKKR